MGAHDYTITVRKESRDAVRKAWAQRVKEDEYESGQGAYAGNATTMDGPVRFRDSRCASENDAYEEVMDSHEKWGPPIAVSFYLAKNPGQRDEARQKKAYAKEVEAKKKYTDASAKAREAFKGAKSKYVGCPGCGSKLKRDLLTFPECPLCRGSLLSDTVCNRLQRLREKMDTATKAAREANSPKPSKKIGWVVGGWAAC